MAGSAGSRPSARGHAEEGRPLIGFDLPGRLNEFAVVFVSVVLQSLPFVLVGVFASGVVQQRLPAEALTRWLPRNRVAVVLLSSGLGFLAPVCDCGVIPFARRLEAKGLPAYAAATLIVAAPVVNPVVLVATAFAFQGNWTIVGLRMAMTLSVAVAVGLLVSRLYPASPPLPAGLRPIQGGGPTPDRARPAGAAASLV